jgi:hypothetical protein
MFKSKDLLSIGADAKTVKGETFGFLTGILYLAPYTTTKWNTCSMAGVAECYGACLFTAGRGAMSNVAQGRINKTIWFFEERSSFMLQLSANIKALVAKAAKQGKAPLIRLNGTSDIRWETVGFTDTDGTVYDNIMQAFPDVQFYDYTKDCNRRDLPANYDLTFSDSGVDAYQKYVDIAVSNGMRIATVFRDVASIPTMHRGMAVVGGDNSDIRHLEDKGIVVALYAKGKAKLDDTGFVFDAPRKVIGIALAA